MTTLYEDLHFTFRFAADQIIADQFSPRRGRLPRRGKLRVLLQEDKFFHIFCKADQASKQDH